MTSPKIARAGFLAGLAALLAACTPSPALLNILVPRTGYHVVRDLAYGAGPRRKLDVYVPDHLNGKVPVLVFFYGGAWQLGSRDQYLAFGQAFASLGIVTVVADYRLYPEVTYPAFVEDGAQAVAWVHAHAAQYGGDPQRLFVSGHSAGGYNAVMLGSDPKYLKAVGGDLSWLRGVIGISGPYDFLPLTDPDYIAIFHGPMNRDAMPVNHIDGPRPPMLLAWGLDDSVVGHVNIDHMEAKLKSVDSPVETHRYPGTGHIGIILSLIPGFRGRTSLRQDIAGFIQSHSW
jgi:acetyl esterase/lipase